MMYASTEGCYLTARTTLWRTGAAVWRPGIARSRFRMELMWMRRWASSRVVTMRIQTIRGIVLSVLEPRDQSFILITKLATHQRWFTHHHYILHQSRRSIITAYFPTRPSMDSEKS